MVRQEVVERGEKLTDALDQTSSRLTMVGLIRLNQAVELDGRTPEELRRVVGVTQTIAPWPVIARPTIRVLTSRVPS